MDASDLWDANATRYLEAIGLTILLYDHVLTFAGEVRLIWFAPTSFVKYTFLFNRYLVLATLITVAVEMCGFLGKIFTDDGCRAFLFTCSMIAVLSVGIANMLVLLRVVILWDHRALILKLMTFAFITSLAAQLAAMIYALVHIIPSIAWSPHAGMCIVTERTRLLIAVWASPMLFEIFVLGSIALNALDRPTAANTPLVKALNSDGLGYFVAVTCLRILNIALASVGRPTFTILGVFFIWAMTTTILSRSLLRLRAVEIQAPADAPSAVRSASPFMLGTSRQPNMGIRESMYDMEGAVEELGEFWGSEQKYDCDDLEANIDEI